MGANPYSDLTRELFGAPAHVAAEAGEPADGASVYLEAQGVRLRLNAIAADGTLTALS